MHERGRSPVRMRAMSGDDTASRPPEPRARGRSSPPLRALAVGPGAHPDAGACGHGREHGVQDPRLDQRRARDTRAPAAQGRRQASEPRRRPRGDRWPATGEIEHPNCLGVPAPNRDIPFDTLRRGHRLHDLAVGPRGRPEHLQGLEGQRGALGPADEPATEADRHRRRVPQLERRDLRAAVLAG